jgi:hypothetical protein
MLGKIGEREGNYGAEMNNVLPFVVEGCHRRQPRGVVMQFAWGERGGKDIWPQRGSQFLHLRMVRLHGEWRHHYS